eukprot:366197-Chlamydomonas_euryale.AAC.24
MGSGAANHAANHPIARLQVIDVEEGRLQNVITFPPEGAFVVDSQLSSAGEQRCEFKCVSGHLAVGQQRCSEHWEETPVRNGSYSQ